MSRKSLLLIFVICLLPGAVRADDVYQYSIRVGQDPLRRAYLWVPPAAQHIRGVIFGVQNMLEQPMFEDDTIRQAATDEGLAIVLVNPRDDYLPSPIDKIAQYRTFSPPAETAEGVDGILSALAKQSGYSELAGAPLIVTAHSASTPFVYGIAATMPSRIIAMFPYKGWIEDVTAGIPDLHVTSEYAEVGGANWGEVWKKDLASTVLQRQRGDNVMTGEFAEIGNGHFEWNPEVAPVLAMFIRKACQYRLPASDIDGGPVTLNPIDPKSGWLLDPATFGTADDHPVGEKDFTGDPTKMLWYFDREMAQTVNDYAASRLAKKPQVIDFTDSSNQPISLANGGGADLNPTILPDGFSFKVSAVSLDTAPPNIYGGMSVGHANGPIQFKVSTGALKQTGPDTFRIWMRRGGLIQQSSPWEPWIMAYLPGDDQYRRCDRPGHVWLYTINSDGKPQFIDFPPIADVHAGTKSITLDASSDSGLPVQLYVISGPVELADDNRTLQFTQIPSRSKFPIPVVIGAYQWGSVTAPKVQTSGPIIQQFLIQR